MNCYKCKHYAIKFNQKNITKSEYCKKFGCFTETLEKKIQTEKLNCCEEGENWITEWAKEAAYQFGTPEHLKEK